jgi:hypothetical protein
MQIRFDKARYGQRWQVETVVSMIKRRLGSATSGRTYWSRRRDLMLMVLTHNYSYSVAVDALGNAYISGWTKGSLGSPIAGGPDAFLTKYSSALSMLESWIDQYVTE